MCIKHNKLLKMENQAYEESESSSSRSEVLSELFLAVPVQVLDPKLVAFEPTCGTAVIKTVGRLNGLNKSF